MKASPRSAALRIIVTAVLAVATATKAHAEGPPSSGDENAALPQATDASPAPLVIDAVRAAQFKSLLLPELYPLVQSDVISFESFARTKYDWGLGSDWTNDSQANTTLAPGNDLRPEYRSHSGFPFAEVKSQKGGAEEAHKILWNSAAALAVFPVQKYGESLLWYKQGKFHQELGLSIERLYPARVSGVTAGTQLFRERLGVTEPAVLAPFSMLTFRFLGADEDLLWLFSPAINKARQLTGADRGDSLLGTPVSLDDLFIWSGKHESIDATVQADTQALVPVAGGDLLHLTPGENSCFTQQDFDGRPGMDQVSQWVGQGRSAWSIFSSLSYAVPRAVWRVELTSNDPFSPYGRQIVTVDQETMLPLLKLAYDRSGHPWKLVMGALAFAAQNDARRTAVYPIVLVHDYLKDETALLRETEGVFCDTLGATVPADRFDIKTFIAGGEAQSSSEEAKSESKSSEKDSEDE